MPVPSRMSVYRVLVRRGLIEPQPRKRPKTAMCGGSGARIKTLRSHLSAATWLPWPLREDGLPGRRPASRAEAGAAIEVDRIVSSNGAVHLGGQYVAAGEVLAGRQVGIRIEDKTLMFFDPRTRELLRTRPSPLTWDQARRLRGARPAGPPPRPSAEPVTVQRVASNTGIIMVAGQKIALGRIHARQTVTVHVAADTITIDLDSGDTPYHPPDHHPAGPQHQSPAAPQGCPCS